MSSHYGQVSTDISLWRLTPTILYRAYEDMRFRVGDDFPDDVRLEMRFIKEQPCAIPSDLTGTSGSTHPLLEDTLI